MTFLCKEEQGLGRKLPTLLDEKQRGLQVQSMKMISRPALQDPPPANLQASFDNCWWGRMNPRMNLALCPRAILASGTPQPFRLHGKRRRSQTMFEWDILSKVQVAQQAATCVDCTSLVWSGFLHFIHHDGVNLTIRSVIQRLKSCTIRFTVNCSIVTWREAWHFTTMGCRLVDFGRVHIYYRGKKCSRYFWLQKSGMFARKD